MACEMAGKWVGFLEVEPELGKTTKPSISYAGCEGSGGLRGVGSDFALLEPEDRISGGRKQVWVNKKRIVSQFTVHPKGCGGVLSCH